VIVTLQTLLFLAAFYFAPKHGVIAARRRPPTPSSQGAIP
jgi:manganese/iron transport system permease protein